MLDIIGTIFTSTAFALIVGTIVVYLPRDLATRWLVGGPYGVLSWWVLLQSALSCRARLVGFPVLASYSSPQFLHYLARLDFPHASVTRYWLFRCRCLWD